jgi:hypothetical protein
MATRTGGLYPQRGRLTGLVSPRYAILIKSLLLIVGGALGLACAGAGAAAGGTDGGSTGGTTTTGAASTGSELTGVYDDDQARVHDIQDAQWIIDRGAPERGDHA